MLLSNINNDLDMLISEHVHYFHATTSYVGGMIMTRDEHGLWN